ncbi:PAS domain S-box protein [Cytophagales bacterium LB-30]|uniref:histidine kinase n=1 Tax=Shiella aurantiaca TaxID=3058365 RepID=A0ABT8F661_9BACT|nr:PAS domain S-box protein [Shiella aurantiaca]MDN4165958.1 PAS domain S-box protein [Shiella aurantiaca]
MSMPRLGILLFLMPLILLMVGGTLYWQGNKKQTEVWDENLKTERLFNETSQLQILLLKAVREKRGYELYLDSLYVRQFVQHKNALYKQIQLIDSLIEQKEDSIQFSSLKNLLNWRIADLEERMRNAAKNQNTTPPSPKITLKMDSVFTERLLTLERKSLAFEAQNTHYRQANYQRFVTLLGLSFALLALSAYFFDRNIHQKQKKAQQQMILQATRESEARFSAAFEHASIGMALVSPEGRFSRVNKSLCKLLGYTAEELLLHTFQDITHPDDLQTDLQLFKQLAQGEIESYQMEKRYFTKNGEIVWINLSGSKVNKPDGSPLYYIAQIENITKRKEAEHSLKEEKTRLENVIKATQVGTWEWNVQTGETIFNERWAEITGHTLAELAPISIKTWEALAHPDDLLLSNKLLQECFDGKSEFYQVECRMKHKAGYWVWVLDQGKVISRTSDGKPLMMFGTHTDITSRKLMEESEHRVAEKLKAINQELQLFAATASHDMKEPLRMIKSFMELLQKDYAPQLDEKAQKYIYYATDGAQRMNVLIEDLLAYAQIGNDDTAPEPIDTKALVGDILKLQAAVIEEKKAQVAVGNLPAIRGKRVPIKLLFQNLISNALKYQAPDRVPHIEISGHESATHWHFSVKDNGIGIKPEYFDRIFQLFKRLHTRSEYAGTGMGLAICKKIVEQHGGEIRVESVPFEGSTFHFSLAKS